MDFLTEVKEFAQKYPISTSLIVIIFIFSFICMILFFVNCDSSTDGFDGTTTINSNNGINGNSLMYPPMNNDTVCSINIDSEQILVEQYPTTLRTKYISQYGSPLIALRGSDLTGNNTDPPPTLTKVEKIRDDPMNVTIQHIFYNLYALHYQADINKFLYIGQYQPYVGMTTWPDIRKSAMQIPEGNEVTSVKVNFQKGVAYRDMREIISIAHDNIGTMVDATISKVNEMKIVDTVIKFNGTDYTVSPGKNYIVCRRKIRANPGPYYNGVGVKESIKYFIIKNNSDGKTCNNYEDNGTHISFIDDFKGELNSMFNLSGMSTTGTSTTGTTTTGTSTTGM
jgi:hypothetical protein